MLFSLDFANSDFFKLPFLMFSKVKPCLNLALTKPLFFNAFNADVVRSDILKSSSSARLVFNFIKSK